MQPTHARDLRSLRQDFHRVRSRTIELQRPWSDEDCLLQAMTEASPVRWHLAHTAWFFEAFVLGRHRPGYDVFDRGYHHLFNSYYESVGTPFPRAQRGLLSRPGRRQILRYREHVDGAVDEFLSQEPPADPLPVIELGLQHEQQHQELMVTDLKAAFALNPTHPAMRPPEQGPDATHDAAPAPLAWHDFPGGVTRIGHRGESFCFDNERPTMRVLLEPFQLASRLVTNQEFAEFVEAGGYQDHRLWLSDGWALRKAQDWTAPIYWRRRDGSWQEFTSYGLRPLVHATPVTHVSYFEADAYARWAGARLPTEAEWETAARSVPAEQLAEEEHDFLHPLPATRPGDALAQMVGQVWQWTSSPYMPYQGYQPPEGPLGEYNGKFMINQMVLRGGSCATPPGHVRPSYRNFFTPETRWQFSGLRLARDRQ